MSERGRGKKGGRKKEREDKFFSSSIGKTVHDHLKLHRSILTLRMLYDRS